MFSRAIEQCLVMTAFLLLLCIAYGGVLSGSRTFGETARSSASAPRALLHAPAPAPFDPQAAPWLLGRYWPWSAPLWNPLAGCGAPLGADPAFAAYAPFNVLNSLAPGSWARDFWRLARLAAAGLGMILLMYRLGARAPGAFVAAAVFCMTGFASGAVRQPMFDVYLWLPALLWATEWLVANPLKFRPAVCLGLIGAGAVLGGDARALMACGAIVLIFFFWRLLLARSEDEYADLYDCLRGLGGAGALMVGTTLFYILPALELRWLSHVALMPGGAAAWPAPDELVLLLTPRFHVQDSTLFSYPLAWVGVGTLALACFAVEGWTARGRARMFFLFLAGVIALRLAGFWLIYKIWRPMTSSGMGWDYFAAPLYLCLSALAGFGAGNFHQRRANPTLAAPLLIILLLGYILLFWHAMSNLLPDEGISAASEIAASRVEMTGFLVLGFLAAMTGLAYLSSRLKQWGPRLAAALAVIALAEGGFNFLREELPRREPEPEPPLALRDWSERPEAPSGRLYCMEEPIRLQDVYRLGLLVLPKDDAAPVSTSSLMASWHSRDLLGGRYLLGDRSLRKLAQQHPAQFRLAFAEDIRIWENLGALPRAWFIPASPHGRPTWRLAGAEQLNQGASEEKLLDSRQPLLIEGPIKRRHQSVLDMAQSMRSAGATTQALAGTSDSAAAASATVEDASAAGAAAQTGAFSLHSFAKPAQIVVSAPHRVVIQAPVISEPGWLILSDQYYPGWHVFVDGKWEKIYRVNAGFRAVFVPPGARRIVFRYFPWTFYLGLAGGAFIWFCIFYFSRKAGGFRTSTYGLPVEYVSLK